MDLAVLEETLAAQGQPSYRAGQVWKWAARGAGGFEEMTNLPAALRAGLARDVPFSTLSIEAEARSRDGTVKTLFHTHEGHPLEAVLMTYRDGRRSLCLSSQSGCPLTCTFCATGQMRFRRNLTASEILDQALHFRRLGPLSHVVFMGMGEPMMNLDEVIAAARRLPDLGITPRRTTISTVGWLPGLTRFVSEVEAPIRLAISLHAADEALRSTLMPVNLRYPLADVLAECRRWHELRRQKVFIEYVMLAGINDRVEQAAQLARLLDRKIYKVNLIPYNPTGGLLKGAALEGSTRDGIAAFKSVLDRAGLPATVRLTRGRDIQAACGQLAAEQAA
jgi:23S rRNA (adenine2503-C2)-methyltransferase